MFYPVCRTKEHIEAVYSCCRLVLYSILLLNIECLLHFDLFHTSMYALRAPMQMRFGSSGSPSENKDVVNNKYRP